jgi:aminopeptidase N
MKKILILTIITATCLFGYAQNIPGLSGSAYCSYKKSHMTVIPHEADNTEQNAPHSFDVLNYSLNLNLYHCYASPYPKDYRATNIITFKVDSALNSIKLNAVTGSLTIDSVRLAGASFTHSNSILTINLNRTYNPNEVAQVKVCYHHNNITDGAFYASNGMVFTDCEPEGARKWYPCWDKPSDKATMDITVKVPLTVKLGSNGILADSTVLGDTITYHWVSADKIATYLAVISSKVNYQLDIRYWHKISNQNDSIPLRFYYNTGENMNNLHYIEDILGPMTTYFSQNFCEHPFPKDGFATLNTDFYWGGMENQTLTSLCPDCWYENLVSHEYAHQWFGDMITCGTWADVWLNESFATWCEAFWAENSLGYSGYKTAINGDASYYFQWNPHFPISMPEWAQHTPSLDTLFNSAIQYDKGACVLHQLRYMLGDSVFLAVLKAYSADTNLKYKSAITSDFMAEVNTVTGGNYDWYFNAWIYQADHPVYQNTYNFEDMGSGNWNVNFCATQVQTNGTFFPMLLNATIIFSDYSDTTIQFMNDVNIQYYTWTFHKQPGAFRFDMNNNIVLKEGSTLVGIIDQQSKKENFFLWQNIPNPAMNSTRIDFETFVPMPIKLEITDITGKALIVPVNEFKPAGKYFSDIDCSRLSAGLYYYKLTAGNASTTKKMIITR